jgi:carbon monoxide dehydrogenase subunit G
MARYRATVDTPRPPAEAFAYLSDFTNAPEWDPGTLSSERVGEGPIGVGSEFLLVASFLGRRTTLTYRIVEYRPPDAVTFRGENSSVVSIDRITFAPAGDATTITYEAELTLKGALRLADPLLALAFKPVGDRATDGLRRAIGTR